MAKPINLYQNQAPAAMSQMGQGLAQAGASIGESYRSGAESMGKGLAGGITSAAGSVASAYKEYKDTKGYVSSSEKAYETIKDFLPKELRFAFDAQLESMGSDVAASLATKKQFWDRTNAYLGMAVKNQMDLDRQQQELNSAMERLKYSEGAAAARQNTSLQSQFDLEQLRQKYRAQRDAGGVNFGLKPFGAGGNSGAGYYNQMFGK